ncbi:serine hydrolase domain-containing protein [Streptomyces cavernicola]|uniref:Serine hydrolase domain-containing protein n=1 Tax=Streptomyces cavernicola TaxID=3043613 RepID=A0ABT6SDZ9_9ACTN|nr:serine hydrolase domain-containing protein [Streptomyces sp. B-S-A6]MDI3405698.1 serine hydrolase domain-containing protein [Streptomyces sp. B-S-A6]
MNASSAPLTSAAVHGGSAAVHGSVDAQFAAVRAEFAAVAGEEPGLSAQLAVRLHGRQVVDLWTGPDVTGDALFALYSSGKGAAHLVTALLVQDGVLDLDRPVARDWPEFAAAGKAGLTLRDLLSHKAGLLGTAEGLSTAELADERRLAELLGPLPPAWTPGGGRYGYHAFTVTALTGEVVRRSTGRTLQEHYAERLRIPYGLDFHLGLPESEERRYLPVQAQPQRPGGVPGGLTGLAFNVHADPPTDLVAYANTRAVRAQGSASSGSVGTARGLAKLYATAISTVDGRAPLLGPDVLAEFTAPHTPGTDLVTGEEDHFLLGFEAQGVRYGRSLSARAFGHSGAVGAQSFADPATGIAYSYTRRRFAAGGGGGAPENHRLIAAVAAAAISA